MFKKLKTFAFEWLTATRKPRTWVSVWFWWHFYAERDMQIERIKRFAKENRCEIYEMEGYGDVLVSEKPNWSGCGIENGFSISFACGAEKFDLSGLRCGGVVSLKGMEDFAQYLLQKVEAERQRKRNSVLSQAQIPLGPSCKSGLCGPRRVLNPPKKFVNKTE